MKAWYPTKGDAPLIDRRIQQRRIKKVSIRPKYTIPRSRKSGAISITYWESREKRKEVMMKIKGRSCEFARYTRSVRSRLRVKLYLHGSRSTHARKPLLRSYRIHRISLRFAGFSPPICWGEKERKSQNCDILRERIFYDNSSFYRRKSVHFDRWFNDERNDSQVLRNVITGTRRYSGESNMFRNSY